jgi:putative radical SAM enzyme (TIGR03279 family)
MESAESIDETREGLEYSEARGLRVREVLDGSPAWEAGIKADDSILNINGNLLRDLIDLEFYQAESLVRLRYRRGTESRSVRIRKDPDLSLGIVVDPPPIRRCPNDCSFCFVDQMPAGARKTLYIRDEDYRYSFLYGNFITLTNLTEKDYLRILEQRLSPLYISVHATDPVLRRKILKNERAPDVIPLLERLCKGGITLHTQVVLMPGVNDGEALRKTWEDLSALYPRVASLAVVPVGLTSHREGLPPVASIDSAIAKRMIRDVVALQKMGMKKWGDPFVYPSDEWYIIAQEPFPALSRYGDLPQLGNGVGLVPLFRKEWKGGIRRLTGTLPRPLALVTGMGFFATLSELVTLWEKGAEVGEGRIRVLGVDNVAMGESVTVAGLLGAGDISRAVKKADLPSDALVLVPDVALRDGTEILVDDGSIGDIASMTDRDVCAVPSTARAFCQWLGETFPSLLAKREKGG